MELDLVEKTKSKKELIADLENLIKKYIYNMHENSHLLELIVDYETTGAILAGKTFHFLNKYNINYVTFLENYVYLLTIFFHERRVSLLTTVDLTLEKIASSFANYALAKLRTEFSKNYFSTEPLRVFNPDGSVTILKREYQKREITNFSGNLEFYESHNGINFLSKNKKTKESFSIENVIQELKVTNKPTYDYLINEILTFAKETFNTKEEDSLVLCIKLMYGIERDYFYNPYDISLLVKTPIRTLYHYKREIENHLKKKFAGADFNDDEIDDSNNSF